MNIELKAIDELIYEVEMFEQAGVYPVQDFIDSLKTLAAKVKQETKLEGCVVVPKDQTEDWYLDPDEHMWWEADGIDGTLCDLNIGEVAAIEHKEYLITASDTLYAAKVWDSENEDVGFWEFFKTEEDAEKAAAHCKAMVEAARGGKDGI
ncbi:hypothetical protein GPS47_14865 [Acinetobacter haemolyticus]|uniref:hypothetical protein n=1 Tax=Acinetobacter haemolyticus TaxID=29430 RepID=UPI000E56F253|nr:hypothetical protein [Acinetobacter haemolyticus]NAR50148.1 hypothetical protein [Acinetobacter haemolyticus]NAR55605.1 hypothetical protein [Acinetobacter haemolyticus]NAS06829.1 hypothetical protein [Acinetobacter haemolyticus]QDJ92731.1 hypothetical protein AhaeAN54_011930 [Acinetobacter haemolyticus]